MCAKLCRELVQSACRNTLFKVKRHAVLLNGRPRGNLKTVTDFQADSNHGDRIVSMKLPLMQLMNFQMLVFSNVGFHIPVRGLIYNEVQEKKTFPEN